MKKSLLFACCLPLAVSSFAQDIRGELTENDSQRSNDAYVDKHEINSNGESRWLRISLNSYDFDTYLIVTTPNGEVLENDDFNSEQDSYIELIADEKGTYVIEVTSYEAGSTGEYNLNITMGNPLYVLRTEGRLDPRDERLPKGEYFDTHEIDIDTGKVFSILLRCYGFDGFLSVTAPDGKIYRNDDLSTDFSVSGLMGLEPVKGKWKIIITTAGADDSMGAYDLEILTEK